MVLRKVLHCRAGLGYNARIVCLQGEIWNNTNAAIFPQALTVKRFESIRQRLCTWFGFDIERPRVQNLDSFVEL